MPNVSFRATKTEYLLIARIADRALRMVPTLVRNVFLMDLTACHANGCPLDLEKMLTARDFDFAHDVLGISRHISRKTGRLKHHFFPRCARVVGPSYSLPR